MSNFANTKIKDTFQRVLQIDNGEIQDGLGLPVDARIQSIESDLGFTGDLDGTATLAIGLTSGDKTIQGNLDVIGKITAIEIYAQYESSSIIFSSGSTKFGNTFDDTHQFTGSVSITGSSFSHNGYNVITSNDTGSIVVNSASYATFAVTASYLLGSVDSASYARTASYIQLSGVDGFTVYSSSVSNRVTNLENFSSSLDATFATDAQLNAATASLSSSIASLSSSYLSTSASFSSGINANTNGISALSSSFISFSGSYNTGSFTGSFAGNLTGTSSYAVSASHALNANNAISASYALTASYVNPLNQDVLISGSLTISGSSPIGSPTASVQIYGDIRQSGYHRFDPVTTNIDTSVSASYIYVSGSTNDLYFSQNGSGYNNVTRLRWLEGNLYTGLLHGGLITTASSTVYRISSGSGIIVNLNASLADDPYPVVQFLQWGNLSASIAPLTASYQQAFVSIDSTGNIYQQGTPYAAGQFDTEINIGVVLFQNGSTINGVKTQPSLAYGFEQQQNIFNRAFGPLKLSGYTLAPSGSSIGSLIVAGGTAYSPGSNYPVDPNNPSYASDNGTNVSKIFRYRQSGSTWVYDTNGGAGYAAIDPTQYSNNGVLTAVPGSGANRQWSIQRVFWFPNSVAKAIVVYYGNATYTTQTDATANIPYEPFVEAPNTAANAIYLGAIVARNNADFTVNASYNIQPGGLFRQVGGSGGGGSVVTQTLAGLSDVAISAPTNGQPLVYNNTSAKWQNSSTLTADLTGNASTATSASYATTASNITPAISNDADTRVLTANGNGTLNAEGNLTFDGNTLKVLYQSGDEGGEILLNKPVTNTTIAGTGVTVDIYQNKLRFFEQGGTARGYYLDITAGGAGVATNLASGGGTVTSVDTSGSVSGITLTGGPITGAGTIVLGGTITGLTTSNLSATAGILNAQLANSSITIGSTNIDLGDTATSLTGLTSINSTSFTGSLLGTASYATHALSASYAPGGGTPAFPYTGSAIISGSLTVTGSTNIQGALGISRALIERAEITVSASGVYTIYSVPTSSYRGIFADYTLVSTSPSGNARAGNIMSVLSGSQVRYTETRTSDIGSTAGMNVQVNLSGGNLNLELNVATITTTWNLVSLVRTI
jgi:hypothetical protein